MPLSWNEIRHRAIGFSKEWTGVTRERAEKQTFWNEFFDVFGISRRAVASFEEPVKGISGTYGYIDLFWPRVALVEHKSFGKDLGKAESQAFRYIQELGAGQPQLVPGGLKLACYLLHGYISKSNPIRLDSEVRGRNSHNACIADTPTPRPSRSEVLKAMRSDERFA